MKHGSCNWVVLGTILLLSSQVLAIPFSIAVSTGDGVVNMTPYRIAALTDVGTLIMNKSWDGHLLFEASAAYWKGKAKPNQTPKSNSSMSAYTTGPIVRWQPRFPRKSGILPFFELGIGASWLSKDEIGGRQLSTHFQFEDRFGVGMRFGKNQEWEFNYRLFHYSNCSMKRPNRGLEFQMITFGRWIG